MIPSRIWAGVAIACALACAPAHAQTGSAKTPTALATEANAFFADNMVGGITPFNTRQTLLDIIASYGAISLTNNTWTGRQTFNYTPVFDLASNLLGVNQLFTATNVTVPANTNYSDIRASQANGSNNTFTVGAGAIVAGIIESPESLAGSDATSNLYGAVLHCTNDGPGTCKGVHIGAFGGGPSTGAIVAANMQIQPIATQGYSSGGFASLTSTGVNNKAIGYGIESTGDQYLCAMCNVVSALPIGTDYIRWFQASSSAAGANFLNLLATDGTTSLFKVTKAGAITAASLDGAPIGGVTPAAGSFTSITASGLIRSTFGTPTIASGACGATTNGTISGSNQSGIVTIGAAATTTCTVSFSATLANAPNSCVIFPGNATAAVQGTTVARVGAPSTTQWVITGSVLANTVYNYICL